MPSEWALTAFRNLPYKLFRFFRFFGHPTCPVSYVNNCREITNEILRGRKRMQLLQIQLKMN